MSRTADCARYSGLTVNLPPSSTSSTPAPLPSGSTVWPVRPATAASFVGLWPTTNARPPSGSDSTTPRSAAAQEAFLVVDEVRVDPSDLFDGGALARSPGGVAPAILDRRAEPCHLGDLHVVLPGGLAQDRQHLRGAGRAGGDERGIRGVQVLEADGLRVSHSSSSQLVPVVVRVPTQLHPSHPPW